MLMTADNAGQYLARLESRHEDLLIDLLARATEARMQLYLLRRDVERRCQCAEKDDLLERMREAEQKHAHVIRKLEGDLLVS